MEKFEGTSILEEIAIGKIHYYSKEKQVVQRNRVDDTEAELRRYEAAKEKALRQLHELYEKARKEAGEDSAAVFDVYAMILEGDQFDASIRSAIESQNVNAEYAVAVAGDDLAKMFEAMDDEYFRARSAGCPKRRRGGNRKTGICSFAQNRISSLSPQHGTG